MWSENDSPASWFGKSSRIDVMGTISCWEKFLSNWAIIIVSEPEMCWGDEVTCFYGEGVFLDKEFGGWGGVGVGDLVMSGEIEEFKLLSEIRLRWIHVFIASVTTEAGRTSFSMISWVWVVDSPAKSEVPTKKDSQLIFPKLLLYI